MCKPLPHPRCSSHARKAYQVALASGDEQRIALARTNYYTTPEGIRKLEEAGKAELADKYKTRRERLISAYKRQERINSQITIGLDLDNTTGDFTDALRQDLAKKLGIDPKTLPEPDHYSYAASGWYNSEDEFRSSFQQAELEGLYKKMSVYPDAVKSLQSLAAAGYRIKIITARSSAMEADTREWLKQHRIPYHELVFSENKKEHHADVYVDDSPFNINDLRQNNKTVITFSQKYNKGIPGARVAAWSQLIKRLNSRSYKTVV